MRKPIIFFLLLLLCLPLFSQKVKTTRRQLHRPVTVASTDTASVSERPDILVPPDSGVILSGFDKPLTSVYETLFATNRLDRGIGCIYLSIEYFDSSGRLLHGRKCRVTTDIPAGETRQLSFRSWDRQGSFYYHRSRRPRRSAAAFSVSCRIDSVELTRD